MLRDLFRLFPAHAGVIPDGKASIARAIAFPRTCGGDPYAKTNPTAYVGFSPHMRG